MANKLFTAAIDRQLANQYKYGSDLSKQKVVAKIFNPYGEGRWFLLNSDPNDPDYIWAIVSMYGEVEMGSVSRSELENIRLTAYRLPLERDKYFDPVNAEELYQGLLAGKFYAKGGKVGGITESDIVEGAKFKNSTGTVFIVDRVEDDERVGKLVHSSLEGGKKGNYRDDLKGFVDFLNEEEVVKTYAHGGGFDQYGNPYGFDRDYDSVYEIHHKPDMNSEKPYMIWDKIDGEYVGAYPNRQRAIEWIERQSVYAKGGKFTKKNKGDEFEIGNYVILFGFYEDGEYITSKTKPILAKSREELDEKILEFIDQFHSYEGIEPEIIGEQKIMADGGGFERKNTFSKEDLDWAESYLEETNNKPNVDAKYAIFYIDISGKYQVYYTLWRMLNKATSPYVKNPAYLGNLSTDLRKAVETARKRLPNSYIVLDRAGTKTRLADPLIIKFGKYRGFMLEDVFLQDPNYVLWLSNNYTGKGAEFSEKLKELKEVYFKNVTEKNREQSVSEYQGQIGSKINLLLKVYRIKEYSTDLGDYEQRLSYQYYFVDADGNKYYTYSIKDNTKYKIDDILEVQGTVAQHKEILGVKYTYLNRLKVLSVITDPTKMFEEGGVLEDVFAEGGEISSREWYDLSKDKDIYAPTVHLLPFTEKEKNQIDSVLQEKESKKEYVYDESRASLIIDHLGYKGTWWIKKYDDYILVKYAYNSRTPDDYWKFETFDDFLNFLKKMKIYASRKFAKGGLTGYENLVKKVAKSYEGKSVPRKYQSEYGKTYDREEAKEVGYKVATKVYGKPLARMKK